jgi:site-specific DNA recombinase
MKAAVYTRINERANEAGIRRQEEACRKIAAQREWDVVDVYRDNYVSATAKRRPAYEQMIEGLRAGRFNAIITYDLSRLSRRPRDLEELISLAEEQGIEIATVASGPIDLTTADGRMVAGLLAAMDAAEAERHAERMKAGMAEKKRHKEGK